MSKLIVTDSPQKSPPLESTTGIKKLLQWFKDVPDSHRVRLISGRFNNLRRLIGWPLLALCFLTPWLTWNDLPLVHLDLVAKQFRFGTLILWPEDLLVLTWMMMAGAFGLFFVAMVSGRLWCGFSCPQTVWTFLFIRLEELIEGSRHKRLKMDRTPLFQKKSNSNKKSGFNKDSAEKLARKSLKHTSWLALSLMTGITFIAYFYPISDMASDFIANDLSGSGLFWVLFIAGFTYLNAGFLREQVCTHMCPYSRFQSVMADRSTLTVQYNEERNDCIDCKVCVHVCPTGIDIRDGIQLECIACGACVDACDDIMEKINKPKGLINFKPAESSYKDAINLIRRPRLIGYAASFLLSIFLLANEWSEQELVNASLERDRSELYRVNANDEIENSYALKLHNKTNQELNLELRLHPQQSSLTTSLNAQEGEFNDAFNFSRKYFTIPAGQRQQFAFTVTLAEMTSMKSNKEPMIIDIISLDDNQVYGSINTSFIAPKSLINQMISSN